ncbi:hypothetical protein PFISCL1PPCAC_21758, partial [Pristionchus fissidentatus]
HCLYLTLHELTKIKDQSEVVKKTCDVTLALINCPTILSQTMQPIDTPAQLQPDSNTEPNLFETVKEEEEDPFEFVNDVLNFLANELKNEDTEPIAEGGEYEDKEDSSPHARCFFQD